MGMFMKEHDIYVGKILEELNVRFAPPQGMDTHHGGIDEMVALQKEFKLFKKGRSLKTSVSALNVCAWNNEAKTRWLAYLGWLSECGSNQPKQNGDVAIVSAIVKNLASTKPLPVYFTSHDMRRDEGQAQVKIFDCARPLHYMEQDFLTISFPGQPAQAVRATIRANRAAKKDGANVKKK